MKKIATVLIFGFLLNGCSYSGSSHINNSSINSFDIEKYEFNIIFEDYFNTELEPIITTSDEKYSIVFPILKKESYIFEGWYMDEFYNQPLDLNLINQNTVLFSKWDIPRIEELNYIQKISILPETEYDTKEVEKMMYNLSSLNKDFFNKMYEEDKKLHFINTILTDHPEFIDLKGVIPRGWITSFDTVPGVASPKGIFVRIGYSNKDHGSVNLELHEIAHVVDDITNKISKNDFIFKEVWNKESQSLIPGDYHVKYIEEYFAETFAYYFYSFETRRKLYYNSPDTYNFMKENFSWGGN